jgi:hypothetical protein
MTPLLTTLVFSLLACLLLVDSASAWHTEIRDHDMLAFGHSRRSQLVSKREFASTTTTSRRRRKLAEADSHRESQSRSWHILHSATSPHDLDYSHTVDISNKSTPRYSKQQDTRRTTPLVRGDNAHSDNNTAEEENEMDLSAATDVTACMSDFGCF